MVPKICASFWHQRHQTVQQNKTNLVIGSPHVFTNLEFQIYEFFTKYYVIFVLITENGENLFWTNKKFISFFTCSKLRNIRGKN